MAKIDFTDWLDRETARHGIDQKEIAALVDQMTVEDQWTALHLKRGISRKAKSERGRSASRPLGCFDLVDRRFRGGRIRSVALS